MSAAAVPVGAWHRGGISDLVEALRARGFQVGTSEAIDATRLLLALSEREPALDDPDRLRARLRPVLCKSREEQERFGPIFDQWWRTLVQRFGLAPSPPAVSELSAPARPAVSRRGRWVTASIILLTAIIVAYAFWSRQQVAVEPAPPREAEAAPAQPAASPQPALRKADTGARIDRYVPAVRYNVELQPTWFWLLAALPFIAFFGVSLPAMVLIRTRLRRRSDPMFLDPAPLALEARRLVPPMPADVADRLARHVQSRGIDIERVARRPVLDVRGTLEATIRNYGIPTLRFSHSRVHPSYLLLIDVANEKDPRGRLFFQWAQRLQQQKLDVEILLLRRIGNPGEEPESVLVGSAGPAGQDSKEWKPLARLRSPAFGERLAMISDGDPLADTQGVWRRAAVQARFHRWHDRALFTPVEPRDWGDRELAIERSERDADPGFIVLPLEESALGAWTDLVLTGQLSTVVLSDPQRFPALLRHGHFRALSSEAAPDPATVEKLIMQLLIYLGDQGFYWLAACAVPPFVRWELTLLLGQAVLKSLPRIADEAALNEALARNYQRLVRLPWLQQEALPTWLRLRLLAELSRARQAELRAIVDHLLGKLSPRRTGDGIELNFDRPAGVEGQRVAGGPGPGIGRTQGAEPDALYLGYMSGLTPEQLVLRAPRTWAQQFPLRRPAGFRGWLPRVRDVSRAWWARLAWARGLPHLGLNRANLALAALLMLPLVCLLVVVEARPSAQISTFVEDWLYVERPRLLEWHDEAPVLAVAVSPDGTRIVSGGSDNTLRLWDAETGRQIGAPLTGHQSGVRSISFSPDGTRIVSGSWDNALRLWDANSGQQIGAPLSGHQNSVTSVAFSPDGTRIVSGSWDNTLRLWDAKTGQPIGAPLTGHRDWVWSVAFSPDGTRIVSGSSDNTLRLWDAKTGQPMGTPLTGHRDWVRSVAFSSDGKRIVSGSDDNTLRLWDANSGQPIGRPLTGHESRMTSVAFSPDGTCIVSGSTDKTLRLWDASSGQPIGPPLAGHEGGVSSVAFSADGTHIVSGDSDGTLRVWDARGGRPMEAPLQGHERDVSSIAFSPDGTRIVSADDAGTLRLWDAKSGQQIGPAITGHAGRVSSVAFSPDGTRIASAGADKTLRLWDAKTGRPVGAPLTGHASSVWGVVFSPDGTRIASGSSDDTLRLWDAKTAQPIGQPLAGHRNSVTSVAFSPDGARIASGSADRTLRLWDAKTGQVIGEPFTGHASNVWSVAFSPDGTRIVSAGRDRTLRLWEAKTGRPIGAPLTGHAGSVWGVAFSPDGTCIVSGSSDDTLRLWDAGTGEQIGSPLILPGGRFTGAVAFSPDGRRVAVGAALDEAPAQQRTRDEQSVQQTKADGRSETTGGGSAYPAQLPSLVAKRLAKQRMRAQQSTQQTEAQGGTETVGRPVIQFWRIDPYPAPAPREDIARFAGKILLPAMLPAAGLLIVAFAFRRLRSRRQIARLVTRASEAG